MKMIRQILIIIIMLNVSVCIASEPVNPSFRMKLKFLRGDSSNGFYIEDDHRNQTLYPGENSIDIECKQITNTMEELVYDCLYHNNNKKHKRTSNVIFTYRVIYQDGGKILIKCEQFSKYSDEDKDETNTDYRYYVPYDISQEDLKAVEEYFDRPIGPADKFVNPIFNMELQPYSRHTWPVKLTPNSATMNVNGRIWKSDCSIVENNFLRILFKCYTDYEEEGIRLTYEEYFIKEESKDMILIRHADYDEYRHRSGLSMYYIDKKDIKKSIKKKCVFDNLICY
ncbi:MAG: hypothetical protein E7016_04065 [Alphaproteobacteria bacterium]|nr:hypothetical protein [Alphaproteobacteria bacterium]